MVLPALAALCVGLSPVHADSQVLPAGFVYLRDIAPEVAQDIRYAGTENFVGRALPGYEAAECVSQRPVAEALAAVQADLSAQGFGLKVYDCYRPMRAVQAMLAWARDPAAPKAARRYFPRVAKSALIDEGYIAARSSHASGIAVDLTLVAHTATAEPRAAAERCGGPPDGSIDMGTGFDCFDRLSETASRAIGAEPRRARERLVAVMRRRGFVNYRPEWWHFGFAGAGTMHGAFDFPIVEPPRR